MFDWLEFDKSVKKGFEDQEAQLKSYIEKVAEKNAQIRDLPIFEKPGEETVERIGRRGGRGESGKVDGQMRGLPRRQRRRRVPVRCFHG